MPVLSNAEGLGLHPLWRDRRCQGNNIPHYQRVRVLGSILVLARLGVNLFASPMNSQWAVKKTITSAVPAYINWTVHSGESVPAIKPWSVTEI